jgi:hypothetical protein
MFSVIITADSSSEIYQWIEENMEPDFFPQLTERDTNDGKKIIRASFKNEHKKEATLFKMFWTK